MRRHSILLLALGAALTFAVGCASSGGSTSASASGRQHGVRLSAGDSVGRRLVRESPEFELAVTSSQPNIATVDTDASGQ